MTDLTESTVNTAITDSDAGPNSSALTDREGSTDSDAAPVVDPKEWEDLRTLIHKARAVDCITTSLKESSTPKQLCSSLGSTSSVECLVESADLLKDLFFFGNGDKRPRWQREMISALHVTLSETDGTPAAFRTVFEQWVKDNDGSAALDEALGDVPDEGSDGCAQGKETHKDLIGDHEDGKETGTPVDEAEETHVIVWQRLLDLCDLHLGPLPLEE